MSEETCKRNKDKGGKWRKQKEMNDLWGSTGSRRDHEDNLWTDETIGYMK